MLRAITGLYIFWYGPKVIGSKPGSRVADSSVHCFLCTANQSQPRQVECYLENHLWQLNHREGDIQVMESGTLCIVKHIPSGTIA